MIEESLREAYDRVLPMEKKHLMTAMLKGFVDARYAAAFESFRAQSISIESDRRDSLNSEIQKNADKWASMMKFLKNLDCEAASPLCHYAVKQIEGTMLNPLIAYAVEDSTGEVVEATAQNRRQIVETLTRVGESAAETETTRRCKKAIQSMAEFGSAKDLGGAESVLQAVLELADSVNMFVRPLDKKREKGLVAEAKAQRRKEVKEASNKMPSLELLCAGVQVLVVQKWGALVDIPRLPWVVEVLTAIGKQNAQFATAIIEPLASLFDFAKAEGSGSEEKVEASVSQGKEQKIDAVLEMLRNVK
eukprot:GHVU01235375.1.p1 GENE.GHVU01235375.1~~GHVU01235375.1.p1  ORF type:complete len:305 (+),score=64.57 GHVU01235375.1:576-1490(+)